MKTITKRRNVKADRKTGSYRVHLNRVPEGCNLKVEVVFGERIDEYHFAPDALKGKNSIHFELHDGEVVWMNG